MIFPILNGFLSFRRAPVTWSLFGINFLVFVISGALQIYQGDDLERVLEDKNLVKTTGSMFSQFVMDSPDSFPTEVVSLAEKFMTGTRDRSAVLGGYALSQKRFLSQYKDFNFKGDQVAIADWRSTMSEIELIELEHPQFMLGVRGIPEQNEDFLRWISYQFSHSGFFHFAGNMVYLLIFGAFLEPMLGPVFFLLSYLLSGVIAAGVFLLVSGDTNLPLVGASGSISGLMAMTTILMWNKPIRYFYVWFMPKKNYVGWIFLPAWITFLVWLVPDFAGFLSSHEFSGGVAFVAHLGGEFAGLIVGISLLSLQSLKSQVENIKLAKVS